MSFVVCAFQGTGSFHLSYQIRRHRVVHEIYFFILLLRSMELVVLAPPSFLIVVSFSLDSLARDLSILLTFSNN